jgi:SLOG cluster2
MAERIIAISVSDGPDLQVFGFLPQHLRRLLASLSGATLRLGWRVGYGGDLRRDGFTRALLADVAASYARGDLRDSGQAPIVHFFAFSSWRDMSPEAILNHLMDKELAPNEAPIAPIAETRFFLPRRQSTPREDDIPSIAVVVEDGKLRLADRRPIESVDFLNQLRTAVSDAESGAGDSLNSMRRAMGSACPMRIQFSGKVSGYLGNAPGLFEEAIVQIRAGGLVLPLAAFGGAAREVAIALQLTNVARVCYPEYGRSYGESFEALRKLADMHRANAGRFWEALATAATLSEPHQIVFHLKEMLPLLGEEFVRRGLVPR